MTFLPVTVMSIRRSAADDGPGVAALGGVDAAAEPCAGAGDGVGVTDEVGPGCEQDPRTRAEQSQRAAIGIRWSGVAFVTIGSLGRFV